MKSQYSVEIKENVPLAPYTTFKIGGPARHFVEVSAEEALLEALNFAKDNDLEFFILGGGSNILVSDDGFQGLVIKIHNTSYTIHNTSIECDAGLSLSQVVKLAAENGLLGMEWAAGIPGTVGGAVRGNAGSPKGCIGDNVESVRALDSSCLQGAGKIFNFQFSIFNKFSNSKFSIKKYRNKNCNFTYRNSIFKKNPNLIILSCVLNLEKGNKNEIQSKMREVIEKRNKSNFPNPKEPSSGSFFKNPVVTNKKIITEFEQDTGLKTKDNKTLYQSSNGEVKIPAGWLIDQAGFRGKKIGGVQVSEKHANFIVNNGNGTAQDVVILASLIKQKVRRQFEVQLKEEISYVGF